MATRKKGVSRSELFFSYLTIHPSHNRYEKRYEGRTYPTFSSFSTACHFYRHLERTLDLSFMRQFVQETYAGIGRPSIDPVVFFKLQLVMFFEGIRAARQLMRHAADRPSRVVVHRIRFG